MVSWKTSLIGLALILMGIAGMAFAGLDKVIGGSIITAGLGFLLTKDAQVTGGSVPQASPPGAAIKSDALGVIEAVNAMEKAGGKTIDTVMAKEAAAAIVATPVSPMDVVLTK